jgi:hypothetical protein
MSGGNWYSGNAAEDGRETRGWLLGHFIDPAQGVRSSRDVEVKWGIHQAGEERHEWTADDQRTTLVVLIEGTFRVDSPRPASHWPGRATMSSGSLGSTTRGRRYRISIIMTVPVREGATHTGSRGCRVLNLLPGIIRKTGTHRSSRTYQRQN